MLIKAIFVAEAFGLDGSIEEFSVGAGLQPANEIKKIKIENVSVENSFIFFPFRL